MSDTIKEIIDRQCNLESLWLLNPTVTEALLQAALRHLHAAIEGYEVVAELAKREYWDVESEL